MKTSSWRYFTRSAGRFNGLFRQEKATVKTVVKTTGFFGRPAGKPKRRKVSPTDGNASPGTGRVKGCASEQPALSEGHIGPAGHDDVIEHAHVDQRERVLQHLGQRLVGTRRLG